MADPELFDTDLLGFFEKHIHDELVKAYITERRWYAKVAKSWGMTWERALAGSITTLITTCAKSTSRVLFVFPPEFPKSSVCCMGAPGIELTFERGPGVTIQLRRRFLALCR